MSESYTLEELISGYFDNEFANVEEVTPRFSIKHKIAMKNIFRQFADNAYKKASADHVVYVSGKPRSIRKHLIILAIIIIGMAILTGFVIMFISNGFKGKVYHDNTHLFAVNTEGCPATIEKEYELSVLPEGYILSNTSSGFDYVVKTYSHPDKTNIYFIQYVKSKYNAHINSEFVYLDEIEIAGRSAILSEHTSQNITDSVIVWDNQDYILELSGNLNKSEIVELAETNEKKGF